MFKFSFFLPRCLWLSHKIIGSHFVEFLVFILGFPNAAVVDAYMKPTVDESMEPFSWASPDVPRLREYPLFLNITCYLYKTIHFCFCPPFLPLPLHMARVLLLILLRRQAFSQCLVTGQRCL